MKRVTTMTMLPFIEAGALIGCSSLASFDIPQSVDDIESRPLQDWISHAKVQLLDRLMAMFMPTCSFSNVPKYVINNRIHGNKTPEYLDSAWNYSCDLDDYDSEESNDSRAETSNCCYIEVLLPFFCQQKYQKDFYVLQ